jgi:hypothetical protein
VPLDHGTVFCVEWTHRELHPNLQRAELASSCWTMSPIEAEADHGCAAVPGLELTSGSSPPPVFKTGSSSGRITSVRVAQKKLRELESNQRPPGSEPGATTGSSCPGIRFFQLGEKDLNLHSLVQSQAACR